MSKSWLRSYLEYTSSQESPELFHLWCGLGILASTLGRNVFLTKTYDDFSKLYPNLYIILVSPSGRCRKGGALGFVNKLLTDSGVKVYLEAITKRALTQELSDEIVVVDGKPTGESKIVIISDELEVFLGKDASMSGLLTLLTRLYDCPDRWWYKTSTQGSDNLYNVCVNILGATIPSWFEELPTSVMSSGFLARLVIVYQQDTPRKNPGVRKNVSKLEKMAELRKFLVDYLVKLRSIKTQLELSSAAIDFYESWYLSREPELDDRLSSFSEREHDLVLKIAMLLAASEGDLFRGNVVGSERIKESLIVIENIKKYLHLAYSNIGDSIAAKGREKMKRIITDMGGAAERSKLLNRTWYWVGDVESFDKVLNLLCQSGEVRSVIKGRKVVYELVRKKDEDLNEFGV